MLMATVLIVEDEEHLRATLAYNLRKAGYDVQSAGSGPEALARFGAAQPDLVLLDVMLPGREGFDVCRDMRRSGLKTPIILLTAKAAEAEKLLGFDLGADDYVTKPFSPRELRARIKAVLRRAAPDEIDVFRFGDTEVDFGRGEVRREGRVIDLSALEFKLLNAFVRNRGRLLTRDQLLDAAWGAGVSLNDRVVDNHIANRRRKLEPDPAVPRHFLNIRGLGYRFDE
jgi:DNA-binding response OmpR family regulator